MKTCKFQQQIGRTAACMKRLTMATKGCGQLTPNYTYFADSWFSGVKTDEEDKAERVDYCRQAKTSHKGFCLSTLEHMTKDLPGG